MAYSDLSQEERLALSPAERSKLVRQDLQGTKPSEPEEGQEILTAAEVEQIVAADTALLHEQIAAIRSQDFEAVKRAFTLKTPPPPRKYFELSTAERLSLTPMERAKMVKRDLNLR
jgi:hypothetical protein